MESSCVSSEPRKLTRHLRLKGVKLIGTEAMQDGDYISAITSIDTKSHGPMSVYTTALLERYPHLWQKFTDLSKKTPKNSRIMHRVKIKQYPNDLGIITAYDADTETYTVVYSDGTFEECDIGDVISEPTAMLLTPQNADENPILTYENL